MSDKLIVCLFGFGLCVWQCCRVVLYSVISIVNAPHTHGIVPMFQPEETAGSFFMFPAHKAMTTSIQMFHRGQNTQSSHCCGLFGFNWIGFWKILMCLRHVLCKMSFSSCTGEGGIDFSPTLIWKGTISQKRGFSMLQNLYVLKWWIYILQYDYFFISQLETYFLLLKRIMLYLINATVFSVVLFYILHYNFISQLQLYFL